MRDMYLLKNTIEIPKSISTATKKLVQNLAQISFAAEKFFNLLYKFSKALVVSKAATNGTLKGSDHEKAGSKASKL